MPRGIAIGYIVVWIGLCVAAAALVARAPSRFSFTRRTYWRWLPTPWKLGSFALATGFFVLAAPYTGDPTWDWFDALLMSGLTFLSAPWSVGTLYRLVRRQATAAQGVVALCLWMFSASWCYDLYIFCRMGFHPPSWFGNLIASSVLYVSAGLMWNLAHVPERGVVFGFMVDGWPALNPAGRLGQVLGYSLVFVVLVVAMMLPFVWQYIPIAH